jgi:hypothetical protein
MCHSLEDAKAAARRANTEYRLASNASKEITLLSKESGDSEHERRAANTRAELQTMEKAVVQKRVQLLTEMVAHPSTSYAIQPPIPVEKLPPQEMAVRYTYTVHADGAVYQPQRDRAWRIPIVWTALNPLFDRGTTDKEVDDTLRLVLPHLTRVATRDDSTSGVRQWVTSNFRACSAFQRVSLNDYMKEGHACTRYPSTKPLQKKDLAPVALYAAKGPGGGSTVQVAVHAAAMESPEQWHNAAINAYVGRVLAHATDSMLTCTCIITDPASGSTHYMSLHPLRSPNICRVTHLLVCDSHGILSPSPDSATMKSPKELQTHHYLGAQNKRFTEMELNSIHATAIAHNDELCHHAQPCSSDQGAMDSRKSARISSQDNDILVSSFPASTSPGLVYTTISVFAYPFRGLAHTRARSTRCNGKAAPPPPPRPFPHTIHLPYGARQAQSATPPQLAALVRALQTRIDGLEMEKGRADGNRDHLLQKLLGKLSQRDEEEVTSRASRGLLVKAPSSR